MREVSFPLCLAVPPFDRLEENGSLCDEALVCTEDGVKLTYSLVPDNGQPDVKYY